MSKTIEFEAAVDAGQIAHDAVTLEPIRLKVITLPPWLDPAYNTRYNQWEAQYRGYQNWVNVAILGDPGRVTRTFNECGNGISTRAIIQRIKQFVGL